jgi:ribosomal protein S21|tara:strand:+ start:13977 stop:14225 length:249 start_codon:yes stop_codon:yes gene_type:complete
MGANKHKNSLSDFKAKGMHVEVRNNDVNRAMRKLKKLVNQEGIIKEIRDRQHFVGASEKRRKAKAQGRKRWLKKLAKMESNW